MLNSVLFLFFIPFYSAFPVIYLIFLSDYLRHCYLPSY